MNVLSCEGERDTEESYQINEKLSDKRREVRALKFIIHSWDHGSVRYCRWGLVLMPDRTGGERHYSAETDVKTFLSMILYYRRWNDNKYLTDCTELSYERRYYRN